ncbi:MAG: DUF3500 domain-containing protein [Ilumatobacteraceae bacterium]
MSTTARSMADVAQSLLATLNEAQRSEAQWSFPSDEERMKWFYTPTDHGGLTLHSLTPEQTRLVMRLLDTGLSRAAYVTTSTIMGLENVLDQLEGWGSHWNFPRGRDPQRYFLRIFGEPGAEVWGWRLGGHHISLHFTIRNGEIVSSTPCFLGADPASSPLLGGQLLRPLGACEDLARDLLRSFSEEQQSIAIVSPVPPTDLVGANRSHVSDGDGPLPLALVWRNQFTGELQDVVEKIQTVEEQKIGLMPEHLEAVAYTTSPKGLAVQYMSNAQRDLFNALLSTYLDRVHPEIADASHRNIRENFDSLHFAWAGQSAPGLPHYYRIQGPRLLIEYDNTTRDGNHVHTVWRDPVNDFGTDALSSHHNSSH